jgi:hypothetical protein
VRGEILTANILSGAGLVVAACRAQPWQSTSPVLEEKMTSLRSRIAEQSPAAVVRT